MESLVEPPALPRLSPDEAGVLLHIGVHKTGTTALQASLAAARPELAELGVEYPGKRLDHHRPARSVMRRTWGWEETEDEVDETAWELVRERLAEGPNRIVLSSEFFGESDDDQARRIVAELYPRRTVVLITLRPLLDLAPSGYQQFLKYGMKRPYESWLERVLPFPGVNTGPFWRRNDHGTIVQRWAKLVGRENVAVVVLDSGDHELVYREFAQALGIPAEILLRNRRPLANRSLTAPEAELVRQVNLAYREPMDWKWYSRYVRMGMVRQMVESRIPAPDEPRLRTPEWAQAEMLKVARRSVDQIMESGVHVSGDLQTLVAPRDVVPGPISASDPAWEGEVDLPLAAVSAAVVGMAGRIPFKNIHPPPPPPPPPSLPRRALGRLRRTWRSRRDSSRGGPRMSPPGGQERKVTA